MTGFLATTGRPLAGTGTSDRWIRKGEPASPGHLRFPRFRDRTEFIEGPGRRQIMVVHRPNRNLAVFQGTGTETSQA